MADISDSKDDAEAQTKAIESAYTLRVALIATRREIVARLASSTHPSRLLLVKLREAQDAVELLTDIIDGEASGE